MVGFGFGLGLGESRRRPARKISREKNNLLCLISDLTDDDCSAGCSAGWRRSAGFKKEDRQTDAWTGRGTDKSVLGAIVAASWASVI